MVSGPRVVLVLSLVVLSLLAAAPGSGATTADQRPTVTSDGSLQPQAAADSGVSQTFAIDMQRDGDARWTITASFALRSENETAAFESLAEDFEDGGTDALGLESYRRASQLAADSTGREMQITNVSRSTNRTGTATNGTGRLSVSFVWTDFGRLDGDRLYIDDVFSTGDGPWFDRLSANQQLVIRPPEGYNVFDAAAPVQSGAIQWTGPEPFTAERLSATFDRTGTGPITPTPPGNNTTTPRDSATGTPVDEDDSGSLLWAGLVTLGLGAVVVGYLLVRERDLLDGAGASGSAGSGPSDGPGTGAETVPPATGSAADEAADEPAPESGDETGSDGIDAELLSDEERVERLLDRNGGRMKQADIVKETKWSNAKVSQLLSAMEEEGRIDKLRIGRENLISFPDEDITDLEE